MSRPDDAFDDTETPADVEAMRDVAQGANEERDFSRVIGALTAADLGSLITVEFELATYSGVLISIAHERYSDRDPKTCVALKRDDWRWTKTMPSDTTALVGTAS